MELPYLTIRFRMSKDSALSFPQAEARKLSRKLKVRVSINISSFNSTIASPDIFLLME